jgi:tetratricopeptide (TPR) repeat protein
MAGREDVFQKAMNDGHSAAWDQMWDKAAGFYKAALVEYPDHPKALNSLGLALYQLQQFDEALKVYQRVAKLTPDDPVPVEKTAQISERLGNLNEAIAAAMLAADKYLNLRDPDKAIENWTRIIQLNPEHVNAHSRLAMVHEKMGQVKQAATEYIAVASLMQAGGNPQKAMELIDHALKLVPDSQEAKQAHALLRSGQMLPKPQRPKGATGPLRMAQVTQMGTPKPAESGLDPISDARQKALKMLAEVLFDLTDDSKEAQTRRGLQAIMRGTGQLSLQQSEQTKILLHLSTAIDAQTKNQDAQAAQELEHALEAGFNYPALHYDLGLLRSTSDRLESALRHLQQCIKHNDYGLGARLLSGQILRKMGRLKEAAIEYLEALKVGDSLVAPPEQADVIRQLYEPLIEAQASNTDEKSFNRLCDSVNDLMVRPNWRENLLEAREQLPKSPDSSQALPLAEILIQAQSSHVIEAMTSINNLARAGRLRSAMDEAFQALITAPTYLPLHSLIGDLLIREGRNPEAIAKFTVVAQAYSVRGEAAQATSLLRRILQLAPMDLAVRTRLIEQLSARGQINEAISEYLELADIYYRLAELDMARKTYTTSLRLAQQPNANRSWNIQILHRMADIDMQRLDWKQALRVYEQIRTLKPDDEIVRKNLIELNLRMVQTQQAFAELDNFITYLETNGRTEDAIAFLENLVSEHDEQLTLHRALAEQYRRAGRVTDAISQLDAVGDKLMETGNKDGVIEVVNVILSMNPPNADEYRQVLAQLQNS